jgi:hypothetical protein
MSQAEQATTNETMTVTVMHRNNYEGGDGWTYYAKTVTISAYCPICGERRGAPTWHNQCEDGEWFSLNVWENPCGHKDLYKDVLIEAGVIKAK